MKPALKIFGILFSFLIFLSVTISDKTIFSYVYDVISPATTYSQDLTGRLLNKSVALAQKYSKKLFDNSVPRMRDSVDSKLSARLKSPVHQEEDIGEEDSAQLDDLIKNKR